MRGVFPTKQIERAGGKRQSFESLDPPHVAIALPLPG